VPVRLRGSSEKQIERDAIVADVRRKRERAVLEGLNQCLSHQRVKTAGERLPMKEERAGWDAHPAAAIEGEAAAGNDAMNVRMKGERLSPGVKDGEHADHRTEPGARDIEQSLTGAVQEDRVEKLWSMENQRMEAIRNGEDDVEVRDVEHLLASLLEPASSRFGSAAGTVTVSA
jgi:hypothetical protein